MFLTLRAFGQVIERKRGMGAIQIALFFVIWDVMAIFWQFLAMILAFSLAMTKIYVAEKAYTLGKIPWRICEYTLQSFVGLIHLLLFFVVGWKIFPFTLWRETSSMSRQLTWEIVG